jgi:hypothetical protein
MRDVLEWSRSTMDNDPCEACCPVYVATARHDTGRGATHAAALAARNDAISRAHADRALLAAERYEGADLRWAVQGGSATYRRRQLV